MSSVSTAATLEIPGDFLLAKQLSIALIGPNEPRRFAVSSVLAEYPSIDVYEFSSYPTHLETVSRLLARQFDIVIVDLDSDPKVALDLVESIRGEASLTVVPYTEEADPEVMARCKRAGAREYLVLPARQSILDRVFARARIGAGPEAQPVSRPKPQVIAAPETDIWQEKPSPECASVHMSDEEFLRLASGPAPEQESGGNGTALESQPEPASHGQVTARAFNDVSFPLPSPGVLIEEIPYTRETALSVAPAEDEDPPQKPGTADTGNCGQSTAAAQWAKFLSGASVAPADPNGAVKWRELIEPVQKPPAIETDEIGILSFHSDLDELGDEDPNRKKWVRIGAASFALLVLLLFVGPRLFSPARHTLAAQSAETLPAANSVDEAPKIPKPAPSKTQASIHPSAAASTRQALIPQPVTNIEEAISPKADSELASASHGTVLDSRDTKSASPQVDSTLMNDQLASAPRIPRDVKARRKEEAPPSAGFDAATTEQMGGGAGPVDSVFSRQSRPTVKVLPPPPIVVPVEVADKLLIHRVRPVYPPAAWNHYVRGKVVLEAVVSETGSVEDLKVVSGPSVFLQSSLDAVKTWRYKPYVVNGKPARVQTTVTLTFDPYRE